MALTVSKSSARVVIPDHEQADCQDCGKESTPGDPVKRAVIGGQLVRGCDDCLDDRDRELAAA